MALALYRRYRPDTFDGVIGQDQVTIPLMRALDAGKLTHAYLFSGPRGCGKTSSARILARCINCAKGPTSHPCGECDSCRDLATGGPGSIDVVEIDAASHNGVDDARELRERAGFAPARDRYKIFILDEAHMVTQQGFNALLKIVEEPPEHVMFIFATTEPDKVIGTIRSRTHHYPFRLVPAEIMGPYLETICEKESIKPEPGVLKLAMRAGGGSVRDTLSVLDQLMVGSVDGVISHDSAVALLGFTPEALIGEAIDAVIDRDGEALYGVIQKVVVGGFDPRRFVEDLLARVRDLLVLTLAGQRAETVMSDAAEGESMADLQRQAGALGLTTLTSMADTINTTLGSMTGAISPRMRLELLAARLLAGREDALPSAAHDDRADGGVAAGVASRPASAGATTRTGFAGAARNQQPAAATGEAPRTTGFAGAARNQTHTVGSSAESASLSDVHNMNHNSDASVSVTDARTAASASYPQLHDAGADTRNESAGEHAVPAQLAGVTPASHAAEEDNRTPDQKWDALIATLPIGVQRYVNRTRIPKILLAADQAHQGRMRLWLKFDKSLSKYAFALAVADEAVDGTTNVVSILRNEVRHMFGENVAIAPTNKMADGSVAPPFSKLPQDQQQKIKAQLLQESLQAAVAKTSSEAASGTASGERESESPADDGVRSADDDEAHRAGGTGVGGTDRSEPTRVDTADNSSRDRLADSNAAGNADPWAQPAPQSAVGAGTSDTAGAAVNAVTDAAAGTAADDPWAQPDGTVRPLSVTSRGPADANRHPQAEHHHKHVAVPDLSDDTDPWAQPAVGDSGRADETGGQPGTSAAVGNAASGTGSAAGQSGVGTVTGRTGSVPADPWDQSIPLPDVAPPDDDDPWAGQAAAGSPGGYGSGQDSGGTVASSASPVSVPPQVDPDDDEYSMDDESLGTAEAMSVDELSKFFDVKKVEEFKSDDPKNPRNIARNNKRDE
ncbi:DNA polymerase III subunit gamma/tau [Bifidobacterium hapali]|uniref:DNA-directed DNA polymerase n=1 Tax=Bifidobacterium hapali TaxID=1630172 RepID=A0A261G1A1_9BIFI|nr:DNA polymerase III subunit gamma/tau [Bifidobacterium hapali]OZG65197.1 DNA polymerase III subunit gamma/tau [Bifidobacterium hapali]